MNEMSQFDFIQNAETGRYDGPYDKGQGAVAADRFNQFVLPDVLKGMGKAVGPWYPVAWDRIPAQQQRRLYYLYTH